MPSPAGTGRTPMAEAILDYAGIALNPALDRAALAQQFLANGGVLQIRDVLQDESAARLHETLLKHTPWGVAFYEEGARFYRREEMLALSPDARAAMLRGIEQRARGAYQYLYHCYPLLKAYQEHWDDSHPLMRWLEFVNTDIMLDLIRAVSGIAGIKKADGQATFYGPGNFLSQHSDQFDSEQWRLAYVYNLTRDWRPDWGGYLQFFNAAGDVEKALMPRFNVLNIFAVPRLHAVQPVASFAGGPRFALTGWFRDG